MTDYASIADNLAFLLNPAIQQLPAGFLDSFRYTSTGNNLAHPVVLGFLAQKVWHLDGVTFVGIDVRLNLGKQIKFQPDIVAFDKAFNPILFIDYESPNSSDARLPEKDVDAYCNWTTRCGVSVPYIILTTLPDKISPDWELRYSSPGYYNAAFHGRNTELVQNPFRFWYAHYRTACEKRQMANIALLNIDGNQAKRIFPEP